jgi:hypothetical protein
MFAIFNYDTNEIGYIAHDRTLLEEILMDIWEEDSYCDFCFYLNYEKSKDVSILAKESYKNCFEYNATFLEIIELPDPID